MNENEIKRNDLDELAFAAITALNGLMTNNTIAKSSKAVVKINRFKMWLNDYWTELSNEPNHVHQ